MLRSLRIAVLGAFCVVAGAPAAADDYAAARADLVAAYQAEDYVAMVVAAEKALQARPGYPGARFNLALAHVLNGDAEASLDELEALLAAGVIWYSGGNRSRPANPETAHNGHAARRRPAEEVDDEAIIARQERAARLAATIRLMNGQPGLDEYRAQAERYLAEAYGGSAAAGPTGHSPPPSIEEPRS